MSARVSVDTLNGIPADAFVHILGGIFEHSPWVARHVESKRPFKSIAELHDAMCSVVESAGPDAQLALIRSHPDLSGKVAVDDPLTPESAREQAGAGLNRCTPQEQEALLRLNRAYTAKFGFPFILAVRGYDRAGIIAEFERRIALAPEKERSESLRQIYRIALLRLQDLLCD